MCGLLTLLPPPPSDHGGERLDGLLVCWYSSSVIGTVLGSVNVSRTAPAKGDAAAVAGSAGPHRRADDWPSLWRFCRAFRAYPQPARGPPAVPSPRRRNHPTMRRPDTSSEFRRGPYRRPPVLAADASPRPATALERLQATLRDLLMTQGLEHPAHWRDTCPQDLTDRVCTEVLAKGASWGHQLGTTRVGCAPTCVLLFLARPTPSPCCT
jgi:hypothetical protein